MAFASSYSVIVFLVGFVLILGVGFSEVAVSDYEMEKEELLGLFEVMGALIEGSDWSLDHPQPCSGTPWPAIECEIGDEDPPLFHVTKIHIGSDDDDDLLTNNPPCKSSASLSESLLKLPYLNTLSIFSCFTTSHVTVSPKLFGALASLGHLSLVSNPALVGEIPSSLSQLSSLRVLSLSQNSLQGKVPSKIGTLVSLEQLDLSCNNLSGQIREEIGRLESLTILDLSQNLLQGKLPSSIGQLKMLQKIDLSSNRLGGVLPQDLGKLSSLVLLDTSHNLINGPIPEALSELQHLEYMVADSNPINTGFPSLVRNLISLKSLSRSQCGLVGNLPKFLSTLKNLTALSLGNNSLSGTIPPDLEILPCLDLLNLSNNELSGEVKLGEDFIERPGKRLVLKGNKQLCTSSAVYKKGNISSYVTAPLCLNAIGSGDQNATLSEGMKHPSVRVTSSAASSFGFVTFFSETGNIDELVLMIPCW